MKTSLRWLQNYVETAWDAPELALRLTMAGLEVEGMEETPALPETVVAARILRREPHPNADRLSVCTVDAGGAGPMAVVCGAPNCDLGRVVPCALPGSRLPSGMTVKRASIRGVESAGMLCAEDELGLGTDHSGLMVLGEEVAAGTLLRELIPEDAVIDWEVTPNRPDWNCHIGIAREIAAVAGDASRFRLPEFPSRETAAARAGDWTRVEVRDPDLCPRYIARIIRNVRVGPSPEWMRRALKAVGIRPISNVVDVTNYVMMECGQPLHAFDYDLLHENRIVVRRAAEGETIVTLDGVERTLTPDALLICDGAKPVALAGVMGGANSEIRSETTTVLLESACFDPANIRRTSRCTGLNSESSYRFERGIDIEMTAWAARRAASLIAELAGGEVLAGAVDVYPDPWRTFPVTARFARIEALLGVTAPPAAVARHLGALGLTVTGMTDTAITVSVPSHRRYDLLREADLIEEVARLHGLDNIPGSQATAVLGGMRADDRYYGIEQVRAELRAVGLDETLTYSFLNPASAVQGTGVTEEQVVRPVNPLSAELGAMRPSLIPGALMTVAHNVARGNDHLAFFELGRVLVHAPGLPEERNQAAVALTGCRHPERYGSEKAEEADFYDLKGILEGWFAARGLAPDCRATEHPAFEAGQCAALALGGREVAVLGRVCGDLVADIRLKHPLYLALVEVDAVLAIEMPDRRHRSLPLYPAVARDISFLAGRELTHREVLDAIRALREPLIESAGIFDIYEDDTLGGNRRSMAYTITYRDPSRTLTDERVNGLQERLRAHLAQTLPITLR
ncbi:MAG: phenylalanine--tRNA ligase subunit beta [Lentisphaeria bacterium]|nr:phenylalanine--tRNA ligase subunit beta [Lentisphaeria bacterium]